MSEFKIDRIKKHVFFNEHILDEGIRRFHPSKPMAEAWERLKNGTFTPNDVKLLEHEYFESKFERLFKTDYRTADSATRKTAQRADRGFINRDWRPDKQ